MLQENGSSQEPQQPSSNSGHIIRCSNRAELIRSWSGLPLKKNTLSIGFRFGMYLGKMQTA